ncbi:MAG: hypothetical protein QF859_02350 [Candidatus Marinimicrobia bacterium]|jgi:hypothetical protein|nr:hypothetical protein [Candidatus Neomarinimicrobiota bacterium]MDP7474792.1 hypothetical protein [Candidatus Neomarinimicrobiota bacterium]HJN69613.1 hypothetical protein [Candidatus Neomarinimicrobiota bacterium]
MKLFKFFLFGIFLAAFWSCSDLGDPEISGCMTSAACNYDPDATLNDESCVSVDGVCETCVDGTIVDNDADNDTVCDADEVAGCMTSTACNYNPSATEDDGSCTVPTACDTCEGEAVVVDGALDGICDTCEDGVIVDNDADNDTVCDADEVAGCMTSTACNYNPSATEDDGSCTVPTACDTCEGEAVVVDGALDGICDTCEDGVIVDNDANDDEICDISYLTQIQPIFDASCTSCHGGSGSLSLTSYENLMLGNSNNGPVVNAGNGANSLIIQKLRGTAGSQMPMGDCCLNDESIDLIETWIDEGAQDN